MTTKCYFVELNSSLDALFEQLDDGGYDYECDKDCTPDGFIALYIYCYSCDLRAIEDIMQWYV